MLATNDVAETYRSLANVGRDFWSLKPVGVNIRPIRHRLADRVRAHAFICMLATYLVFHLRRAWAPLTFTGEAPPKRDGPVLPAGRSKAASNKASRRRQADGTPLRPFQGAA